MGLQLIPPLLAHGGVHHPVAGGARFGSTVSPRDEYKIIHYFICNISGRGQMFITFIANELLSNNLVNSEPALIFLLKFLIC